MNINNLIPKYISYLDSEKGFTKNTIRRYEYSLLKFINDTNINMVKQFNTILINQEILHIFWESLNNNKQLSISARRNYIAAVKSFIKFLSIKEYIELDFSDSIVFPKPEKIFKDGFTKNEQILLREYLFNNLGKEKGNRNAALFFLLLGTALRIDEALNLKCQDNKIFNPDNPFKPHGSFELFEGVIYAHIFGKGHKERKVPLDPIIIKYISYYLKYRENKCGLVFTSIKNNRSSSNKLTNKGCNDILRSVLYNAGIQRKLTTHTFRHTWAVNQLHRSNANSKQVISMMGITEQTLEIYFKRDRNLIKDFAKDKSIFKDIPISKKQQQFETILSF